MCLTFNGQFHLFPVILSFDRESVICHVRCSHGKLFAFFSGPRFLMQLIAFTRQKQCTDKTSLALSRCLQFVQRGASTTHGKKKLTSLREVTAKLNLLNDVTCKQTLYLRGWTEPIRLLARVYAHFAQGVIFLGFRWVLGIGFASEFTGGVPTLAGIEHWHCSGWALAFADLLRSVRLVRGWWTLRSCWRRTRSLGILAILIWLV